MDTFKKFLANPALAIPIGSVIAIAIAWGVYDNASTLPDYSYAQAVRGTVPGAIAFEGSVAPAEEIDLGFGKSGTVGDVLVHNGQTVSKGQTLATLSNQDSAGLVSQAKGAYEAAQANLAKLQDGTASTDIAVSQASLASASQALSNLYSSVPDALSSGYAKANDAVRTQLYNFFASAESPTPRLTFASNDSQATVDVQNLRVQATQTLNAWHDQAEALDASSSRDVLSSALSADVANLAVVSNLLDKASVVLNGSIDLSPTSRAAYMQNVSTAIAEVNASSASLNALMQSIAAQQSSVALAQAQLNQKQAPARPEDIQAAQAQVDSTQGAYQSALGAYQNSIIAAPIDGVITFVNLKPGESATANQTVLGMISGGTFELVTYVDGDYLSRLPLGTEAEATLDGIPDAVFPVRVADTEGGSVVAQSDAEYKVTFEIEKTTSALRTGLRGKVTLPGSDVKNVLTIPRSALIGTSSGYYVLVKKDNRLAKTPVTVGLVGKDLVEVASGLSEGDAVALIR